MNVKRMTAPRSTCVAPGLRAMLRAAAKNREEFVRAMLAALLAVLLAGGPVWAQDPGAPPQQPAAGQEKPGLPTPQTPAQDAYTPGPTNPPIPVSLGTSKYHF